ncbi:MAG: hypothetical protein GEV08_12330 [Acidimicrobiia bacterium]|nr:hypothetical protein [Acidimicrobiia bacterium]
MPPPPLGSEAPRRLAPRALRARVPEIGAVVAALLVRAIVMWLYAPAVNQYYDAVRFARAGATDFFADYWTPVGYASFLAALRPLSSELAFTIGVQHALGIAGGFLLAGAAKSLGVPRPWHLLAGVFLWFGGDFLYFEHVLMSETLFIFTIALTVYLACRGLAAPPDNLRWFVLAGLAAGATTLVRWNGLFLLAVPVLLVLSRHGRSWPSRAKAAVLSVAPCLVLLGGYLVVSSAAGYSGTSDMNGWLLYSRVAPFLDCAQTSVDDEHPELCEVAPPGARFGPLYYSWQPESPARALFGLGPEPNDYLLRLGLDTIRHEPVAYARAVAHDVIRLFAWSHRRGAGHGQMVEVYDFSYRDESVETMIEQALDTRYDGVSVRQHDWSWLLHDLQMATRARGWMMLVLTAMGAAVVLVSPRGRRAGPLVVLAVVGGLWALPILSFTWDFRYALPGTALLPLGAVLLVPALSARRARAKEVDGLVGEEGDLEGHERGAVAHAPPVG